MKARYGIIRRAFEYIGEPHTPLPVPQALPQYATRPFYITITCVIYLFFWLKGCYLLAFHAIISLVISYRRKSLVKMMYLPRS